MEYYGGLLLLLFLLLHISIKLFFSSLFFSSFSLSLSHSFSFTPSVCAAFFFARPDSCCCGWRRAQKMLMCSCKKGDLGEREREKEVEKYFPFHSFEYFDTDFLWAQFTFFQSFLQHKHIFCELGVRSRLLLVSLARSLLLLLPPHG